VFVRRRKKGPTEVTGPRFDSDWFGNVLLLALVESRKTGNPALAGYLVGYFLTLPGSWPSLITRFSGNVGLLGAGAGVVVVWATGFGASGVGMAFLMLIR